MITALIIIVYIVFWVLTGVIVMDREGEICTAVLVGMFWPLALPIMGIAWLIEFLSKKWCK